jgi:glycosyltransferase involved in cell wall biosynthesis
VPLVMTAAASLEGYVEDGETAVLVPGGDAQALRAAVDRLLASPEERERLRSAAWNRALEWQVPHYFEGLTYFAHGRPVRLPPAAPGAAGVSLAGTGT